MTGVGFETLLAAIRRPDLGETRRSVDAGPRGLEHLKTLAQLAGRLGPPLRSPIGRRYDLYGDLVARNPGSSPALVFLAGNLWREANFRDLNDETARLATLWRRVGVGPGAAIAIGLSSPARRLIALLTCLRMGATAHIFPDGVGPAHRAHRRLHYPTAFVLSDVLEGEADDAVRLPAEPDAGVIADDPARSFGYAPEDTAVVVHGGFEADPARCAPIPAERLFGRALTDALLVMRPPPGARVAAPDFEPSRHQLLPLAVLAAGATWVETTLEVLLRDHVRIDWAGVSPALRDAVLEGSVSPATWRGWFKDPAEPHDPSAWRTFAARLGPGLRGQNLVCASSFGGALLFSAPLDAPDLEVVPTPGWAWQLEEPGAPGQVTESPAGVLAGAEGEPSASATGRLLLSDTGSHFLFAGSLLQGRAGVAYPAAEVEAIARSHPAVDEAVAITAPRPGVLNGVTVSLLVFVDPARDPAPVASLLDETLRARLRRALGPSALPDRVLAYPLTPRIQDGAVDREWCRYQLQTGGLRLRASSEIHRLTSLLRRWAAEEASAATTEET